MHSYRYICESPRQGYTEPPTTTTTVPPEIQCPGLSSHKYNGHCYEYFGINESPNYMGWSFDDGRAFCKNHYSGDLVSWGSKAEEDDYFGTSSLYTPSGDYWIGLREDEGWGYEWVDGSATDYTNWMDENPNSQVSCDWWWFVSTEKAPTRAFSWLKAATTAFSFKTLLRHYAKRALTPRSLNVKLGPRR